ncbi:hypothetical protein GGI01_001764 [Coemansia sp. RSA 376]|nr:hypothetical protein LPJ71_004343 [Coemansia sp. S17]KAJ2051151.1 hypothetical protein H4S04_002158 [Coemansia sp. S16]KAJ2066317.1 hypothetical protein GGI08_001938 [Coemansia sp. S2]KAJ2262138.1 hypothetical protein GGI01_001764 [Coemansia sp. RSA 376]KAJ2352813.1 hypothetical protein GGH92_001045 [Coemansia sp. RSA 2673]KAJ2429893.1 hypothetical protein GGF41_001092 [Coemansia sp. RSA 2531]
MDVKLHSLFDSTADQLTELSKTISTLTDTKYTTESDALPGSTIGKHVRHILDHFTLLFSALTIDPHPTVSYSHRERNTFAQDTVAGGVASIEAMAQTARNLREQDVSSANPITISDTMPGGNDEKFLSTVGRELWFCTHHMIHHNAIIASLMHEFGLHPPTQFAYAPSTIKHKPQ